MIKFSNVGKTYVSKSKSKVEALKNVSFELGASGMTFILGKSGSGKSTLLNLLGGLDKPTVGSIQVDGVDMQSFTQSDYENYRNGYVGFVFQEYNLLDDFNVKDNVALALQLSKDTDVNQKVMDALKQVELSEEYLTRRVGELSGGEKQRVAIARALIKDSKMILADEPTGNLDSETGESIWNILKTLSQTRSVIVVSHDRESADKYADRIIEISDGKVIEDNGAQSVAGSEANPNATVKNRLSFAIRLKMAFNNLQMRKGKTVSVILVAIFSILSILITQMCVSFSPEAALAEYMTQNDIDYFTVGQGHIDLQDNKFNTNNSKTFYYSTKKYVANNAKYIQNGLIESKQDILDFGLTFVGEALEIDNDSFYATTKSCYDYLRKVEVDGEYIDIVKELHPIEFLVGKKVSSQIWNYENGYILAGVIDAEKLVNPLALPQVFSTENFKGKNISYAEHYNYQDKDVVLHLDDKQYSNLFANVSYDYVTFLANWEVVLTADGIVNNKDDLELANNEIVLTFDLYEQIFNANSKTYYINSNLDEVRNIPPEIGQTFSLKFSAYDSDELIADYGEVKLAGIVFINNPLSASKKYEIWTNNTFQRQMVRDLNKSSVLIRTSSIKNLREFLMTFRRDYLGVITDAGYIETTIPTPQDTNYKSIAEECYAFETTMSVVSIIFFAVGAILMIVLILLVINLISFSIASRKKEIGILSAIGASNKDITSIFLLETAIISAISFVILLALSFVSAVVLNIVLSIMQNYSSTIPFLRVGILTVAILTVSSFDLMLLAALIPIRKIIKLKPIDAIRNIT